MTTREELQWLVEMLRKRAKENREDAKRANPEYVTGLYNGYASAYESSAKWIEEILASE